MIIAEGRLSKTGAASGGAVPWRAWCEWGGEHWAVFSSHGAVMALARVLVAAGCEDQPWEALGEDGARVLYGPSLLRISRLTFSEGERGMRLQAFRERIFQ